MNKNKVDKSTIDNLNEYSWDHRYTSYDEALSHAERAEVFSEEINYSRGLAYARLNLAVCHFLRSRNEEAFPLLQQAFEYFKDHMQEKGYVNTLLHMGNIYESYGDYEKGLDYCQKALINAKDKRYEEGEGDAQAFLGLLYTRLSDHDAAQKAYISSLEIRRRLGNQQAVASSLNRLAQSYCMAKEYDKSLEYYTQSRQIRERIEKHSAISWTYLGIASTYEYMNDLDQANAYYSKGADHEEVDIRCKAQCLTGSGRINRKLGNMNTAKKELHEAEMIVRKLSAMPLLADINLELAKYYEKEGEHMKALGYYKEFQRVKEEVLDNETANRLKNQQILFAIEKSEKEKEIFQLKNVELKAAFDEINRKNTEITDSIEYAKRIQSAMLPKPAVLESILPEHFIRFLPRDIVSGDFYWATAIGDDLVLIAADCTGHGVPGAFMSMLGMSFLDDIVNKRKISSPAKILSKLRNMVVTALKQRDDDIDSQDGMDIAVCTINKTRATLSFAGAYNPLYLIRNEELIVTAADRMPVGISSKMEVPFKEHVMDLQTGDRFFIFSDGYPDQFGGKAGKKLKSKAFRQVLSDTSTLRIQGQKAALLEYFHNWRGDYEQIDDVIVIGVGWT